MNPGKIFKNIIVFLFIVFIALFISQVNGYYEYNEYKKVALTNEQIKEFESDLKAGKKIDIKDYVANTKKEYGNTISDTGLTVSLNIERYIKKAITASFGLLSDLVSE
ncbi:MAG: hypothetical protein E7166_03055 [Firmicutes bacterium]|nr:hypothetical protein [Bacillota bacterium]